MTQYVTAEKRLLTELASGKKRVTTLNELALRMSRNEGYVIVVGEYAFLSKAGMERLDTLQD